MPILASIMEAVVLMVVVMHLLSARYSITFTQAEAVVHLTFGSVAHHSVTVSS